MKVAILSESPADEAAIRILVEACLDRPVEPLPLRRRPGGVDAAFRAIGPVIRQLHHQRQAEHIVVVVDANRSPVHTGPARQPCGHAAKCRRCRAWEAVESTRKCLRPMDSYEPVRVAVGMAVPAVEAWYLCGKDPNVSENAWAQALRQGRFPYTRAELKRRVYGTDRPSLEREKARAVEEMQRVVQDMEELVRRFPAGCGSLVAELRSWVTD